MRVENKRRGLAPLSPRCILGYWWGMRPIPSADVFDYRLAVNAIREGSIEVSALLTMLAANSGQTSFINQEASPITPSMDFARYPSKRSERSSFKGE